MCVACNTTGFTEETGCYWRGRQLEKLKNIESSELCRKKCQDHPQWCHAYVYYRDGNCLLKQINKIGDSLCAARTSRKYIKAARDCDVVQECYKPSKL